MSHTMKSLVAFILLLAASGCGGRQPSDADSVLDTEPVVTLLQTECREYLENGPPEHMDDYVPESLTEIIIANGAKGESLDPELAEIGELIVMESESLSDIEDPAIREYLRKGADLVKRVLEVNQ